MDKKNKEILKKLSQQRVADIKERDKQRREVETKIEKLEKKTYNQSYEPLASTSTSSSSPWSDKKQESNWEQEKEKNSRYERQKDMEYNNLNCKY